MKTDVQRIAHYQDRMLSSLIDPVLAAVTADAVTNFSNYIVAFYPKQVQLREILAALPIPTTDYGAYEAYHGELYHVSTTTSGAGAVVMATILVTKYSAYLGVPAAATLKKIANDLYGIIVP
jgi:hypothetical protein